MHHEMNTSVLYGVNRGVHYSELYEGKHDEAFSLVIYVEYGP